MLNPEVIKAQMKAKVANKENKGKLLRAYRTFAGSDHGKVILADLEDKCGQHRSSVCETAFCNEQTNFAEGKRWVWLYIDNKLTEVENEV